MDRAADVVVVLVLSFLAQQDVPRAARVCRRFAVLLRLEAARSDLRVRLAQLEWLVTRSVHPVRFRRVHRLTVHAGYRGEQEPRVGDVPNAIAFLRSVWGGVRHLHTSSVAALQHLPPQPRLRHLTCHLVLLPEDLKRVVVEPTSVRSLDLLVVSVATVADAAWWSSLRGLADLWTTVLHGTQEGADQFAGWPELRRLRVVDDDEHEPCLPVLRRALAACRRTDLLRVRLQGAPCRARTPCAELAECEELEVVHLCPAVRRWLGEDVLTVDTLFVRHLRDVSLPDLLATASMIVRRECAVRNVTPYQARPTRARSRAPFWRWTPTVDVETDFQSDSWTDTDLLRLCDPLVLVQKVRVTVFTSREPRGVAKVLTGALARPGASVKVSIRPPKDGSAMSTVTAKRRPL